MVLSGSVRAAPTQHHTNSRESLSGPTSSSGQKCDSDIRGLPLTSSTRRELEPAYGRASGYLGHQQAILEFHSQLTAVQIAKRTAVMHCSGPDALLRAALDLTQSR